MVKEIEAQEEREKYIKAWNETMLRIWQERITLLEVIDTGKLLASPVAMPVRADGRFVEVTLSQEFLEYGLNLRDFFGDNLGREFQGIMADTFERLNKLY